MKISAFLSILTLYSVFITSSVRSHECQHHKKIGQAQLIPEHLMEHKWGKRNLQQKNGPLRMTFDKSNLNSLQNQPLIDRINRLLDYLKTYVSELLHVNQLDTNKYIIQRNCDGIVVSDQIRTVGVPNSDLHIYIKISNTTEPYLAAATACQLIPRCTFGTIEINIYNFVTSLTERSYNYQFNSLLHETVHLLGFSIDILPYFLNQNGNFYYYTQFLEVIIQFNIQEYYFCIYFHFIAQQSSEQMLDMMNFIKFVIINFLFHSNEILQKKQQDFTQSSAQFSKFTVIKETVINNYIQISNIKITQILPKHQKYIIFFPQFLRDCQQKQNFQTNICFSFQIKSLGLIQKYYIQTQNLLKNLNSIALIKDKYLQNLQSLNKYFQISIKLIQFLTYTFHKILLKQQQTIRGYQTPILILPKLTEQARKIYNCSSITGMQLENQGSFGTMYSHFEQTISLYELMGPSTSMSIPSITNLTLAVLDDSNFYTFINYTMASPHVFANNAGCDFFNNACQSNQTQYPQFCYDGGATKCDNFRTGNL